MPVLDETETSSSPSPSPSDGSPMPISPMPGSNNNGQQIPPELQSQAKILALVKRTGYAIVQENGQRRYGGPPPDWPENKLAPSRGCEVFVGKIPRDCYEDELVPLFETVGRIYELRLMMNFGGENRGYAFVMFTSKHEAQRAIRELNNFEIRKGRSIGVCLSVDNCRLFIGGIPKSKTKEETLEEMKKITSGVVDVIMYPSVLDKTKNRGFAFVEYESHKAAAMARRKLIPGRIQLWNQQVAVDWAEPERSVDDDTMSKVKILYIRNLMMATTEQQIELLFNNFLQKPKAIERVKKINDFAFVHFNDRDDALRCLEKFNNTVLDSTVVEITLAKPPDKTTQKQQQTQQQSLQQLQGSPVKMVSALEYNGIPLFAFAPHMPLFGAANNNSALNAIPGAGLQQFGTRNNNAVAGGQNMGGQGGKFSWKVAHQQQHGNMGSNGAVNRGGMRNASQQAQHHGGYHSAHLGAQFGLHPGVGQHPLMLDPKSPFGNPAGDSGAFYDPALTAAAMLMGAAGQQGFDASALLQQNKLMTTLQDVIKGSGAGPQTPSQQQQAAVDQQQAQADQQQHQLQQLLAPPFVPSPTTAKMAHQVLEEFCSMNNLPLPQYQMYVQYLPTAAYMTQSSAGNAASPTNSPPNEESDKADKAADKQADAPRAVPVTVQTPMFACVVTIPGLFSASSPRFSADQNEAKHLAAMCALSQLGASSAGFLSSPSYALMPNGVVPMSPVATSMQMRGAANPFQIVTFAQPQQPANSAAPINASASGHVHQVAAGVVP